MSKLFSSVKNLWKTKPLFSNCVTYGALYGAAELSQQCLIRKVFVSSIHLLVAVSHNDATKGKINYHSYGSQNAIPIGIMNKKKIYLYILNRQKNQRSLICHW